VNSEDKRSGGRSPVSAEDFEGAINVLLKASVHSHICTHVPRLSQGCCLGLQDEIARALLLLGVEDLGKRQQELAQKLGG